MSAADYYKEKIQSLILESGIYEGDYVMSIVPLTWELAVAEAYPDWVEKRYSEEEMRKEARALLRSFSGAEMHVLLGLIYRGDIAGSGRSIELSSDLNEYVTMDNDRGQNVRCTKAELPFMSMVGPFNPDAAVRLFIPTRDADGLDMLKGAAWLRFTIGGLGFKQNQFVYSADLGTLVEDAPEDLKKILTSVDSPSVAPPLATTSSDEAPATAAALQQLEGVGAMEYANEKIIDIFKAVNTRQGNFVMSVVPVPPELVIAQRYPEWSEKRYPRKKMVELAKDELAIHKNKFFAKLVLVYQGNMMSGGEQSKEIPSDIAEYIFLENDRDQSARCKNATLPMMRAAGPFSNQVEVVLEFPLVDEKGNSLFDDAKEIRFVVGGLGFKNNTVRYKAPISSLFADAPSQLTEIYKKARVSKLNR